MDPSVFSRLETYMHSCMEDSAHDREHVYRVLYHALDIAFRETTVNYDILLCACLLHDIGRREQRRDPNLCHAEVGSQLAYDYLLKQGFSADFAEQVRHCIAAHRFRKQNPPQSLEAKILFDADKLDVTGAVGIARTLQYQGGFDRPLYTVLPDGSISDGSNDEALSFFQEYRFKLEGLYSRFYTRRGAELAAQRQAAAADFVENLYRELSAPRSSGQAMLAELLNSQPEPQEDSTCT